MNKELVFTGLIKWLLTRVGAIYILVLVFCLTCLDLKTLEERIKVRHLNDAIPDFSDMILFSKEPGPKRAVDWRPYKDYFTLVLGCIPGDKLIQQLLGYVDLNMGREHEAVELLNSSCVIKGKFLFFPNYNLGVYYYKKGMWALAEKYLIMAVASNRKISLYLMQNSLVFKQIFSSPYFKYDLNEDLSDVQSRAFILLLASLYNLKQYDQVVIVSNMALSNKELSFKDAFYYYDGLVFYQTGLYKKAFMLFQKSLLLQRDNPYVYYYLAQIYAKSGQTAQETELLQASYALHQKNDPRFPYDAAVNFQFF